MHRLVRGVAVVSLAVLPWLLACDSAEDDTGGGGNTVPTPAGTGIRQGLLLSQLETGGWVVCHEDTFADQGAPIADILSACAGPYLMLACAPPSGDALTLAAADARAVVLQADPLSATAHHVANGVGWYFTSTASWGFFPAGETVNRSPCDDSTASANDRRLCWHANVDAELSAGYRCGDPGATGTTWRRLVLTHP